MNVKRITLTEDITEVSFSTKCGKWLVKNFSNNDIFVSFDENAIESQMIKIQSQFAQVIVENEYLKQETFKHNSIYIKGTGEVEVQQLCYH